MPHPRCARRVLGRCQAMLHAWRILEFSPCMHPRPSPAFRPVLALLSALVLASSGVDRTRCKAIGFCLRPTRVAKKWRESDVICQKAGTGRERGRRTRYAGRCGRRGQARTGERTMGRHRETEKKRGEGTEAAEAWIMKRWKAEERKQSPAGQETSPAGARELRHQWPQETPRRTLRRTENVRTTCYVRQWDGRSRSGG